jgi:hypothetical protein
MYLEFVNEDATESAKTNVDSIEPTLSDCGNECFWPNVPHLMLKKGTTSSHEYITHFPIMRKVPVSTVHVPETKNIL